MNLNLPGNQRLFMSFPGIMLCPIVELSQGETQVPIDPAQYQKNLLPRIAIELSATQSYPQVLSFP